MNEDIQKITKLINNINKSSGDTDCILYNKYQLMFVLGEELKKICKPLKEEK